MRERSASNRKLEQNQSQRAAETNEAAAQIARALKGSIAWNAEEAEPKIGISFVSALGPHGLRGPLRLILLLLSGRAPRWRVAQNVAISARRDSGARGLRVLENATNRQAFKVVAISKCSRNLRPTHKRWSSLFCECI
jgi:hypothetical protein